MDDLTIPAARRTAARLGRVGVWSGALATASAADARTAAAAIEDLGYGSLWIGETPRLGREALSHAAILLAATDRIVVATGIANIWLRDAAAMTAAANTLAEAYPGRFVLGIGASHAAALSLVGRDYDKPLTAMRTYLTSMDDASYLGPAPAEPVPIVVAALRTRMQELARDRSLGVHSFFVSPEHTAAARTLLGPDPLLVPEQAVVVNSDGGAARHRARQHVQSRLALPNYVNHLRALGYGDEDLAGGGSDRLVDDLVAWGTPAAVAARIEQHLDAGADHVAVHPLEHSHDPLGLTQLAQLGPLLTEAATT
jgi:probable F420-dependent oxidoreductase